MIFVVLLLFGALKAPISLRVLPQQVGEDRWLLPSPTCWGSTAEPGGGPLRRILLFISSYLQEDVMDKIKPLTFARHLRADQTSAELKLWWCSRRRGVGGFRFNRQFRIAPYVVDFVCREKAFIVEVDGATHGERHEVKHDEKRTEFLVSLGFQVYRVGNVDVYENLECVLDGILMALNSAPSAFQRKAPIPPLGVLPQQVGEDDD